MKYKFLTYSKPVKSIRTKFRNINTSIPAPGTNKILKHLYLSESRSMQGQLPIVWKRAKDFAVYDISNNKFIDFTSTIFVANIGHSNKRLIKYLDKSLKKPLISTYAYPNEIRAQYHKKLLSFAGKNFQKAFLLSSGSETTEAVLKLMRMYADKIKKRKKGIICFEGSWHGRSLGSQMMSGNLKQREWIGYQDANIHHIPFPYPWKIKKMDPKDFLKQGLNILKKKNIDISKDICGFMIETFQGWCSIFYPKVFIKEIKKICNRYNILLAFDEMQSGFGRTGKKFGYEHYDVEPDLICCGKGMGGGIPISGVIGKSKIMDLPEIGDMSSTHSANPLSCSAGLAVIDEIKSKNLIYESKRKGKILLTELEKIKIKFPKIIKHTFGKGLIAAILFKSMKKPDQANLMASKITEDCMRRGLLVVHTDRESIKIGPPLTISDEALLEGIQVLKDSIKYFYENEY